MSLQVIRAGLEHLEALALLFDGYRQFYKQESDLTGVRAFLEARLQREESVVFLALEGTDASGFTQLYPSFSSVSMARLWILNDLFVAPGARGKGVGEALLARAAGFARETGAVGLQLETAADNFTAQRLYKRCGWKRDTEFYTYVFSV